MIMERRRTSASQSLIRYDGRTYPVTGLVERLESRRVRRHVGRVDKVSDTTLSVGSPRPHAVLFLVFTVFGDLTDQGRERITPACNPVRSWVSI